MPELKHNFTQGSMNKDLDDRLVPNGQYRHALNVQVATSEDSDIGTIQNIVGNVVVNDYAEGLYPNEAVCLATIADEKNNSLYYFIQETNIDENNLVSGFSGVQANDLDFNFMRDLILEYKPSSLDVGSDGVLEPVFIDVHTAFSYLHPDPVYNNFSSNNTKFTLRIPHTTNSHANVIKAGMQVIIADVPSNLFSDPSSGTHTVLSVDRAGLTNTDPWVEIILDLPPTFTPTMDTVFKFMAPKVLFPFNPPNTRFSGSNKHVTGINIIDDLLLWTDNVGEPKKINIIDSKNGTSTNTPAIPTCLAHKELQSYASPYITNPNTPFRGEHPVEEKHITVIKKSPKIAPSIELFDERIDSSNYSGICKITSQLGIVNVGGVVTNTSSILRANGNPHPTRYDFSSYNVGDILYLKIESNLDGNTTFNVNTWNTTYSGINTSVVIKEYSDNGEQPAIPITDYRIKGTIVPWVDSSGVEYSSFNSSGFGVRVAIQITSIDGHPPEADLGSELLYVVDKFIESEKLFEFKFPRFAYRWKYKDGEYSSFSPFSEVAFLPGAFDFHPKKGYNLGMTNRIKTLNITNFFNAKDTPEDVVEIELLFKDEQSTNIYVVDTIKSSDEIRVPGAMVNHWDWNSYTLSSEIIRAVVPSNQLLRPWDNVPRKALAQEVVGNRVVYANYIQNFDLLDSTYTNTPFSFTKGGMSLTAVTTNTIPFNYATKSIKSLREYQLGVVFSDKYDRQTPVISSSSASHFSPKESSWASTKFSVEFSDSYPVNMDYFKLFVKETADEYYNMAMDRFYDAGDGNIWLAFPSSDRNKVDIDTFLILKKGLDDTQQVTESARYKILAIESNAPDYIKTTKIKVAGETHNSGTNDVFGPTMDDAPGIGDDYFNINYAPFYMTSGSELHDLSANDKLYVEFGMIGSSETSERYEVAELTCDYNPDSLNPNNNIAKYYFKIKGVFGQDVSFITDDPQGINSTQIINGATISVYKYQIENRPQFDGRFFVKILNDDIFAKHIENIAKDREIPYKVVASQKIYKLPNFNNNPDIWGTSATSFDPAPQVAFNLKAPKKTEFKSWFQEYKFSGDKTVTGPVLVEGWGGAGLHSDLLGYECGTANGWTMYYGCQWDAIQNQWVAHSKYKQFNTTPPPEYWFIDDSTYVGNRWDNAGYFNFGGISSSSDRGQDAGTVDKTANGILPLGNSWRMDLGFGGIWSNEWDWNKASKTHIAPGTSVDDPFDPANNEHYVAIPNFWDIGKSGGNTKHLGQSNVVSKLVPGAMIRWKEDPTKSIYTIQAGLSESNRIRYRRNDELNLSGCNNPYSPTGNCPDISNYSLPCGCSDRTQGDTGQQGQSGQWNGPWGSDGPPAGPPVFPNRVDNASNHDSREGQSEGINTSFTNPANFTKIWKTRLEPEITWDPINSTNTVSSGYSITLTTPNNGAASATNGKSCLSCGSGDPANDFKLVVDTIIGVDSSYGNVQIGKGMVLTQYTNLSSSTTNPVQNMIVKEINFDSGSGQYHISLCGSTKIHTSTDNFVPKENTNLIFKQPVMNGFSPQFIENYHYVKGVEDQLLMDSVGYTIEFIEPIIENDVMPDDPACWETEPKESVDLEIYYEASDAIPMKLSQEVMPSLLKQSGGNELQNIKILNTAFNVEIPTYTGGLKYIGQVDSWYLGGNSILHLEWDNPNAGPNGEFCVDQMAGCIAPGGVAVSSIHASWSTANTPSEIFIESHGVNIALPVADLGNAPTVGVPFPSPTAEMLATISGAYTPTGYAGQWSNHLAVSRNLYLNGRFDLKWHNCYAFGNGVESNRIRDNFNLTYIKNGVKASTVLAEQYKEEHRKHGLIYSGLYNSISGTNNLNQFIQAEKITKDINPIYGSIQKLHTRDSDLVTLCEDKVLRILANKDAVYNADGNPQLTATENVLGQTIPFVGEYGISTNPESFASESYRSYFADRTRGAVIRLSKDGLTPISDHGMRDWFRDRMKQETLFEVGGYGETTLKSNILGSYDDRQEEYNITFGSNPSSEYQVGKDPNVVNITPTTVSFKESSRGWVSFKSFVPEQAISCNNDYFTFVNGKIWKHHTPIWDMVTGKVINHNTFYDSFFNSSVNVLLNDVPEIVKSYKTLNYEGSKSRTTKNDQDNQYHNLKAKKGWYVSKVHTDLETGSLKEFIEKEGKWFNYLKGQPIKTSETGHLVKGFDADAFAVQGLGYQSSTPLIGGIVGCTDATAFNYNPSATVECGNCCVPVALGCIQLAATNYDPLANTDDGSCIIEGCTDNTALNYNPIANFDDGSCAYPTWGCTDPTAFNYNQNAINDDGGCYPYIYGCMDSTSFNYNNGNPFPSGVQVDVNTPCDGTFVMCAPGQSGPNCCCLEVVNGCTEPTACNYDPLANTDDGSCRLCGDTGTDVDNFDGAGCNSGCIYCVDDFSPFSQINQGVDFVEIEWGSPSGLGHAVVNTFDIYWEEDGNPSNNGINNINANSPGLVNTHTITGLNINTTYNITITSICSNSESAGITLQADTQPGYYGCTDNTGTNTSMGAAGMTPISGYTWGACNYDPIATIDDNSCEYTSCAGCTDSGYIEYNASFTQPSSTVAIALGYCTTPIVLGCTDMAAFNYNPLATVDDGSCCYIVGCMDPCATNYNENACQPCPNNSSDPNYVDDCCTYGELCDAEEFLTINSAPDEAAPNDIPPSTVTDQNGNGLLVSLFGASYPGVSTLDFSSYDSVIAQWFQGSLPDNTCEWHKFYTDAYQVTLSNDNNPYSINKTKFPTWNGKGPVSFIDTGKLLFEPADVSVGPNGIYADVPGLTGLNQSPEMQGAFASGVYQKINSIVGDVYSIRIVLDNWTTTGGGGIAMDAGPEGAFQIMVCDSNFKVDDASTHNSYNTAGWLTLGDSPPGCIYVKDASGFNISHPVDSWPNTGLAGKANHMPDGINWSWSTGGICPCAGIPGCTTPCTFSNPTIGYPANYNLNNSSQKEIKLYWEGIGQNDIVYVSYNAGAKFYTPAGLRGVTSSRSLWNNPTLVDNSAKAAEVSVIEVLNESNPCDPTLPAPPDLT